MVIPIDLEYFLVLLGSLIALLSNSGSLIGSLMASPINIDYSEVFIGSLMAP